MILFSFYNFNRIPYVVYLVIQYIYYFSVLSFLSVFIRPHPLAPLGNDLHFYFISDITNVIIELTTDFFKLTHKVPKSGG